MEFTAKSTEPEPLGVMGGSPASKIPANLDAEEYPGLRYQNPADIPVSPGGEIEDEAVQHPTALIEPKRRRPDVLTWKA